ncbi:MAG: D-inositol-3-phosphate glycosyltransferase [Actinomycetota bacterium]|nr:D-inositol-3-phosphate glycosyltransferase [Actinomycetota bacterium]
MTDATWPTRVAMLSVHTSPLEQPGTGDAGGLNVYVVEVSRRLAARGIAVEIFTRRTREDQPDQTELFPGVTVRHIDAGPFSGFSKQDLPGQLCAFVAGLIQAEASREPGWYDLVHSHYWLAGHAGWLAAERWRVPLVHTMHTLAKVKNASLAAGDTPEPASRIIGEEQIVSAADRLVANTQDERRALVGLYGACPDRISVVPPGVDLETFAPGGPDARRAARRRLGLDPRMDLLLFVGRIQPLKAPDVLVRAVPHLFHERSEHAENLRVVLLGGPSGNGLQQQDELDKTVAELGLGTTVRFLPPARRAVLADWYRAADLVVVPSHSETFGLVALEAQACGTPVVAAAVGGLRTAVRDGVSGVLVQGHNPHRWGRALAGLLDDPGRRQAMSRGALAQASRFSWEMTVDGILDTYARAGEDHRRRGACCRDLCGCGSGAATTLTGS